MIASARSSATLATLAVLHCIAPASADDSKPTPKADPFAIPDALNARTDVSSDNLFGFTDGTDTNDQGEREFSLDTITRFGKRAVALADGTPGGKGRFAVTGIAASFQYGVTDSLSVEPGIFGDLRHVRGVPGIDNTSVFSANGGSVQVKYRLIERSPDNPIGLAVQIEPSWTRIADQDGTRENAFSLGTEIIADVRLVPGLLWYGVNIGFEPQAGRYSTGAGERQSTFTLANALSMRVLDISPLGIGTYLGVEARYQRAYSGLFGQSLDGEAAFVGPTFFHQFSKNAYFVAAWSTQVWGRQHDPAPLVGHKLDLWNFERNLVRVKVGFNF